MLTSYCIDYDCSNIDPFIVSNILKCNKDSAKTQSGAKRQRRRLGEFVAKQENMKKQWQNSFNFRRNICIYFVKIKNMAKHLKDFFPMRSLLLAKMCSCLFCKIAPSLQKSPVLCT
jgi:hypothetical protein